jgi:anthranilate synthase component 1
VADLETPVSAMLKLAGDQRNAFLLESVEGGAVRGRYSMIGLRPTFCSAPMASAPRRHG